MSLIAGSTRIYWVTALDFTNSQNLRPINESANCRSTGKGSPCSCAASSSPHKAANVNPREPKPVQTHNGAFDSVLTSWSKSGNRFGVAQRIPAQA